MWHKSDQQNGGSCICSNASSVLLCKSACSFHKFMKYKLPVSMTATLAGGRNCLLQATIRPSSDSLYFFHCMRRRLHWVERCSFMKRDSTYCTKFLIRVNPPTCSHSAPLSINYIIIIIVFDSFQGAIQVKAVLYEVDVENEETSEHRPRSLWGVSRSWRNSWELSNTMEEINAWFAVGIKKKTKKTVECPTNIMIALRARDMRTSQVTAG